MDPQGLQAAREGASAGSRPPGSNWSERWPAMLALLAAAFWWGSLTVTGFVTVPLLFAHMPTPAAAGGMAAKLFAAQTWIALGCGVVLMAVSRGRDGQTRMDWAGGAMLFIAAGLLLALLSEFAIAPRIVARDNLRLWHSIGTGMYMLQWVCAFVTLWKVAQGPVRYAGPS